MFQWIHCVKTPGLQDFPGSIALPCPFSEDWFTSTQLMQDSPTTTSKNKSLYFLLVSFLSLSSFLFLKYLLWMHGGRAESHHDTDTNMKGEESRKYGEWKDFRIFDGKCFFP